jgi:hypothetical protein
MLIRFILTIIISFCPSVLMASTAPGDLLTVTKQINVRGANSLNGDIIHKAKPGEVFMRLLGMPENGFVRVRFGDGLEGWIYEEYVVRFNPDKK